ncbi:MAG: 3'(2'),5'-bisphosphate nucleotidase CysQ [Elainella sp.]
MAQISAEPISQEQIQAICRLMQDCGQTATGQTAFQVYEKGKQDYVTDVDRALDQQLTRGFSALFPADPIITEENPDSWQAFRPDADRLWLIDPLDGTDDFIQGSDYYALMVGLSLAHQPLLGWIYAPALERLYYGGPQLGLFQILGSQAPQPLLLQPPAPPSADFCPILIGSKDQRAWGEALLQQIPNAQFSYVGSFGLKVMQVVLGQAGLYTYFNRRVKLWDTTGPLALAAAAGLVCCDLNGAPLRFTPDAVASETLAHRQTLIIGWPSYVEALLPRVQQAVQLTEVKFVD